MSDPNMLEYEEEDVFLGEQTDNTNTAAPLPIVNTAEPISAPTTPYTAGPIASSSSHKRNITSSAPSRIHPTPQAGPSTGKVYKNVDDRLRELQDIRRSGREDDGVAGNGVRSLKALCTGVIKSNSARIWDIGDLEYPLIKSLIDDMPIEQLQEVETNSPHIKKDTDWLYEIFLLQDFPLFHERCQDRHGEPRTSGWRRMYKKAKEDFAERKTQAADRVAARYKQLEDEKASKRIVIMDRIIPDKKPVSKGGGGWGKSRFGSSGTGGLSSSVPKPQNAIAKARLEAQRARVALTHASGRYIPPTPQRSRNESNQLFKNPYLPNGASSHVNVVQGPRIPPPRSKATPASATRAVQRGSSPSSPINTSPIPGSYPTFQTNSIRKSLSSHLNTNDRGSSRSHVVEVEKAKEKTGERFKIDGDGSKKQYKEIRRPPTEKFVAPELEKEKSRGKGIVMDFFASPTIPPNTQKVRRSMGSAGDEDKDKDSIGRKRKEREEREDEISTKSKKIDSSPNKSISSSSHQQNSPISVNRSSHPSYHTATGVNGMTDDKVNSVLFRKKKVVKGK